MNIERTKLALLLGLDYVNTRIAKLTSEISNMNVVFDNVGQAFDERQSLQCIAAVLQIRLGYVHKGDEGVYEGIIIEDANLIQQGFLQRLQGL
jgi:hypothetical protein